MPYTAHKNWYQTAKVYATRGWKVVPVHGVKGTGAKTNPFLCTCGDAECTAPGQHPWMDDWMFSATDSLDDLDAYSQYKEAQNIAIVVGRTSGLVALVAADADALQYVRQRKKEIGGCFMTAHFASERGWIWLFQNPFGSRKLPVSIEVAEGVTLVLGPDLLTMPLDFTMGATTDSHPRAWRLPFPKDSQLPPIPAWVAAGAEIASEDEVDLLDSAEYAYRSKNWDLYDELLDDLQLGSGYCTRANPPAVKPEPSTDREDAELADSVEGAGVISERSAGGRARQAAQATAPTPRDATSSTDTVEAGGLALASWPKRPRPEDPLPFRMERDGGGHAQVGHQVAGPWVRAGTMTLLLGLPKVSGSTTFLLNLSHAVIRHRDFLGFGTRRSPVLYLSAQSSASFQISHSQATPGLGPASGDFCLLRHDQAEDYAWLSLMQEVVKQAKSIGTKLLVIDGLDRFVTIGDNGAFAGGGSVLRGLSMATNAGLAVVAAMHQHDAESAPQYYDDVVRAADQKLSLLPVPHCDSSLRELRAESRFSDTPEVISMVYDPVAKVYRVTESPEQYPGPHSIQYELTDMLYTQGDGAAQYVVQPAEAAQTTKPESRGHDVAAPVPYLSLFSGGATRRDETDDEEAAPSRPGGGDGQAGHFTLRPVSIAANG